ncbi:hypothetical protein STRPO_1435 [Streptococcus porcinus str. Jelinkova 176]|uniref:Uncharacterized protein n=1 Tax=Streptococcus porcinus str. Jelinkova 176 TaxID=873448 RepID=A0ABN0CT67_STRPO|nr:hypothetical protein STRPO_1435 [Streptococcus porcinus str. Jelinkova 176]
MFVKYFMTNLLTLAIRKQKENSAILGRVFFLETKIILLNPILGRTSV